jgi:hypothetical protein
MTGRKHRWSPGLAQGGRRGLDSQGALVSRPSVISGGWPSDHSAMYRHVADVPGKGWERAGISDMAWMGPPGMHA